MVKRDGAFLSAADWWMGIKLSYSSKQQYKGLLELQRELLSDTGDCKV